MKLDLCPIISGETLQCDACEGLSLYRLMYLDGQIFLCEADAEKLRGLLDSRAILGDLPDPILSHRSAFLGRLGQEMARAYAKHGRDHWGRHEFYAILLEEVDELWDAIKADHDQEIVEAELIQVAAVCLRYYETRDRYRHD